MIVTAAARRTSKRSNPDPVVLIRSSAYSSLPSPGNRVGTGDASNMPTIQATTGCSFPYALANCSVGDIIELTAGATYTPSTSFTLRAI